MSQTTLLHYCSFSFSGVIYQAWASLQGVAVSRLTRCWLTMFITCGACQQPQSSLNWAGHEDGGMGVVQEKKELLVLAVSFTPSKHVKGDFPLTRELLNTDRTELHSPVTYGILSPGNTPKYLDFTTFPQRWTAFPISANSASFEVHQLTHYILFV